MVNKRYIGVDVPFVFLRKTFMAVKATVHSCVECSFDENTFLCSKYECIGVYRKDKTNVIFKEV